MKATKKILSLVLALLLVCSSFSVLAETGVTPVGTEQQATDPDGGDKVPDKETKPDPDLNTNPSIPPVNTPDEPEKETPDPGTVRPVDPPIVPACDHSKLFEVMYDCTKPVHVQAECPDCGSKVDVVLQPPAGHKKDEQRYLTVDVQEPTCAKAGYELRAYYCKYCDYLFETERIDLPKIDHDLWKIFTTGISDPYGKDKTGAFYFPTDDNGPGEIKFWNTLGIKDQDRDPDADTYDKRHLQVKTLAPTCEEDGYVRVTCDVCDLKTPIFGDVSNIRLMKLGHHWITEDHHPDENGQVLTSKPATCTEYGYDYQVCDRVNVNTKKVCGAQRSVTLKPLGHDFENDECEKAFVQDGKVVSEDELKLCRPYVIRTYCVRKDATTEDGTNFRYNCKEYKDSDIIKALYPHNDRDYYPQGEVEWDELEAAPGRGVHWSIRYKNNPECAHKPGEAMIQCLHCNEWWTIKLVESDADESYEITKDVTCTEDGEKTWTCNICGATRIEVMPAPGHVSMWTVQKPTCTKAGSKVETCLNCGKVLSEEILPAAHKPTPKTVYAYSNVIWDSANEEFIAAYCTVDGSISFNCAACGAKNITMKIKAPGHDMEEVVIQEATCTKPEISQMQCMRFVPEFEGFVMTGHGTRCTYTETPYETAPANGHNMVYVNRGGWQHAECEMNPITHVFACNGVLTAPTCEKDGVHQAICTVCGFNGTKPIPAFGHHYAVKYYKHHEGCDGSCEETCQGQYVLECIFCKAEKIVEIEEINYTINTDNVTIGTSKTTGKGTVKLDSGVGLAKAYARITWGFTDKNGDSLSFCVTNPVDANGTFKMNGPTAPVGYNLTNVFVMITDNEDADTLSLSDTPNYGYKTVK